MELNFGPFNAPSAENSPLDLPFTPKRIKVKVQQQEQASTTTLSLNNSGGSASGSEHPCSSIEVGNSACSDTSTDCWITAVISNHDDYSSRPTSSKPNASSKCIIAAAGTGTLCSEPTGHVQSPMQELATLLTGCPPQLHAAFMHTAAALAEQSEHAKEELMQQQLLAQQGCGDLSTEQLQQLLQRQQAQRYSLIPIVALPMLLAAAQPHWCGADISYAALQIRCHLNVVANFQVDTPIAADTTCMAAGGGGSLAAEPVPHGDANVTVTDFAGSSSCSSSSSHKQQQQQQHEGHQVSVDPPCDLMYAELASTILTAAATEAAVSEQQLPQAVQALLLDFTAELSSTPELQEKLQQAFAEAAMATAAAAAAVQRVNTGLGPQGKHITSSSAGGLSSSSSAGAKEPFEDRLPVVKAVKVLCKLLVGAAGLSDIRLLAWLTCLVRQQHLDNHHSLLQHTSPADVSSAAGLALPAVVSSPTTASTAAAAAAEAASDAALISCGQLLEALGQLVQGLGGSDEPCLHHTEGLQSLLAHGLDGQPCPAHTHADCCWGGSFSCWAHGDHQQEQQQELIPHTQEMNALWHQGASISDTSGPGWAGPGAQRRRARCNYRSSTSSVSSEGWPDEHSSSFHCSPEGLDIRDAISEDGEGDSCSSPAHRGGRASLSHHLSSSRPHYGIYSSAGRAAHRPLSISGSLGDGVPDYMAAAVAAGHLAAASCAAGLACAAPQQQRGTAAVAPCSPQRMLGHQETWPGKSSTSSGCRAFTRSSSSNNNSGTYRNSRLSRLSLPGTALGGLECSSRVCGSWGLDNSRRSSSRAIWALEAGTLQQSPDWQRCSHNHQQQQRQLQHMYSLQEQERIAQQQAWQHEMMLEHQPWEGAVSPVAASSTNWAFGGCQAGSIPALYSSRNDSSSDSCAKVVDILRISSCSGSYRSPCFSDSAAQDH